jgi:nucleosome-remodeling factor subunit BPTF
LRDEHSSEEKPTTGTVASRSRTSKWRESQEERRRQQVQTKLQVLLFRHKELLKKDMIKKRALLEKELQIEIQVRRMFLTPLVSEVYIYRVKPRAIVSEGTMERKQ